MRLGRLTIHVYRGDQWRYYRYRAWDWRCWKLGRLWVYWW